MLILVSDTGVIDIKNQEDVGLVEQAMIMLGAFKTEFNESIGTHLVPQLWRVSGTVERLQQAQAMIGFAGSKSQRNFHIGFVRVIALAEGIGEINGAGFPSK